MSFLALGIGLPKTGTTTLCKAFREAGIIALHHSAGWRLPPAGSLMVQAWKEGRSMNHYLHEVEVVTQLDSAGKDSNAWPQFNMGFLRAFRSEYPLAWIILHTRKPELTAISLRRWGICTEKIAADTPGITEKSTNSDITRWINDYYFAIRHEFKKDQRFLDFRVEDDPRERLTKAFKTPFPWWGVENPYGKDE